MTSLVIDYVITQNTLHITKNSFSVWILQHLMRYMVKIGINLEFLLKCDDVIKILNCNDVINDNLSKK